MTPAKKAKAGRQETRRVKFTQKVVESMPIPPSGRYHVYDTNEDSLGLRGESTGRRGFFWFRRVNGKAKWIPLGTVEVITVDKAREEAKKNCVKANDWKNAGYKGDDPFGPQKSDTTFE